MLRGAAAALSDLALDFADGVAPARRAAAMRAAGPLIALFAHFYISSYRKKAKGN